MAWCCRSTSTSPTDVSCYVHEVRNLAVIAALAIGCGGGQGSGASEPAPVSGSNADGFSLARQTVGEPADGLVLRSIRHAPHPGYYRLVFDIALSEGVVATRVPVATAVYRAHDKSIAVQIAGVRHDLTGNRPLRTESGEAFGKPVPVDRPPVSHYARELVLDDSLVAYRIQLTRTARFRLHALEDPARVVLDVEASL